jgi:hypothetical protein
MAQQALKVSMAQEALEVSRALVILRCPLANI